MLLLSFLGEQPLPALLPLWSLDWFDATCLVPTEQTEDLAKELMQFLNTDPGFSHLRLFPYFKIAPYDLARAQSTIQKQLEIIQDHYDGALCFNLTGGTKLMSMAGMLSAFDLNVPMIYVATEKNQIISMHPGKQENAVYPLQVKISIQQYFSAHGIESSLDQSFSEPDIATDHPPKEGDQLEAFVFRQAVESGYFDDVKQGLYVRKPLGDGQFLIHELDVVVIRNGRLAVCSCKSGKYDKAYLAELEALTSREKYGIYCGKVFVSGESAFSDYRLNEFRVNDVMLVYGDGLAQAAESLLLATEV
jgi:hypothetical protein